METSLFRLLFLPIYVCFRVSLRRNQVSGRIEGLLAAAVIASRIDAASSYCLICSLPRGRGSRRTSRSCYGSALWNCLRFLQSPLLRDCPSYIWRDQVVGGLQINRILFHFLRTSAQSIRAIMLCTAVLLCISPSFSTKAATIRNRPRVIAFLLGYAVFALRLVFLSSWVIWKWYDYPLLIGYIACAPSLLAMCATIFRGGACMADLYQLLQW